MMGFLGVLDISHLGPPWMRREPFDGEPQGGLWLTHIVYYRSQHAHIHKQCCVGRLEHTCAHPHPPTLTHPPTRTSTHMHTHTPTHTHMYTQTCRHRQTHRHTHACMHACTHAHTHVISRSANTGRMALQEHTHTHRERESKRELWGVPQECQHM